MLTAMAWKNSGLGSGSGWFEASTVGRGPSALRALPAGLRATDGVVRDA